MARVYHLFMAVPMTPCETLIQKLIQMMDPVYHLSMVVQILLCGTTMKMLILTLEDYCV